MLNQKLNNVLIAIPCLLLGGTEYQTLNLVKALKELGYKVTVLCYFEYDSRMVEYMQNESTEVILMSSKGMRPTGVLATFKTLFRGIKRALEHHLPDIVHVQYLAPGALPILIFKLLGVKKIITTAHVPGHIYKRKWIPKMIMKYISNLFITVSQSSEYSFFNEKTKLYYKGLIKDGLKHCTVYNCVEVPTEFKESYKTKTNNFTIGVVSRLSHEKGIDRLIEAFPSVLSIFPNTKLLIVGDGAKKEELQMQAKSLKIDSAIQWAGRQPKESLSIYYDQMDIVVIPSRFEAFGLTAIEAMSYTIPVVASSVDGLKEIIEDDHSGILVDCSDPSKLSSSIISLFQNNTKRKELGLNGYSRVKAKFNYNAFKQEISEIYSELH